MPTLFCTVTMDGYVASRRAAYIGGGDSEPVRESVALFRIAASGGGVTLCTTPATGVSGRSGPGLGVVHCTEAGAEVVPWILLTTRTVAWVCGDAWTDRTTL